MKYEKSNKFSLLDHRAEVEKLPLYVLKGNNIDQLDIWLALKGKSGFLLLLKLDGKGKSECLDEHFIE